MTTKSKHLSALLTTAASLATTLILLPTIPLRIIVSAIKPSGIRFVVQLAMIAGILFGLTILVAPLTRDGISEAFKSTNINWATGEDGEQFIQSVGLISFQTLSLVLLGSIAVIAVCTGGSAYNLPLISQARAQGIIERYRLMDRSSDYDELCVGTVHILREKIGLKRLQTSYSYDELTTTPSSGIWYLFGLLPCVIGSYILPVFWASQPSFFWIDNAGGILADAVSWVITLGKGGLNLRGWPWAVPIAGMYYGLTIPTCFKFSKLTFNILLISHLEEQDVLISQANQDRGSEKTR
jgi:hypothetical protein